jgi:hypothetical protein
MERVETHLDVALGAKRARFEQRSLVGHTPTIDVQASLHVVQSIHNDIERCRDDMSKLASSYH